jgi:hypothetical protein
VTRVGEFSSIGRLFTFGSFLKVTEVAQNFKLLFSHGKSYVRVLTKMGWVKFGSIFYKLIWSPWRQLTKLIWSPWRQLTKLIWSPWRQLTKLIWSPWRQLTLGRGAGQHFLVFLLSWVVCWATMKRILSFFLLLQKVTQFTNFFYFIRKRKYFRCKTAFGPWRAQRTNEYWKRAK